MRKMNVDPFKLFSAVSKVFDDPGLLLVSVDSVGNPNVMAIGWGIVGPIWGMPTFTVLVRPSRYTHGLIEKTMDFTVNVPGKGLEDVVSLCGSKSGRDVDKFAKAHLTPVRARSTKSPIIKECVAHFECSVVCQLHMTEKSIRARIRRNYKSGNYHTLFIGKILHAYADPNYKSKLPKRPLRR
jgi:flavin reductase (DIM6/NTAB) family NADH-FMN oxidoreductase RutF